MTKRSLVACGVTAVLLLLCFVPLFFIVYGASRAIDGAMFLVPLPAAQWLVLKALQRVFPRT